MTRNILGGVLFAVLAVCSAADSFAAPASVPPPPPQPKDAANYKISFMIKVQGLESAGNFVVHEGAQVNYVRGGETPYEVANKQGTGIEFKKHGTIVNCLPVAVPDSDRVILQCQFELSGAIAPATSLKVRPIETFQLQTEFSAQRGKTVVLVDEADRHLEVKVEELK